MTKKEYIKEYNERYYQEHKEQLKEYARLHSKDNQAQHTKRVRIKRKGVRQFIQEYKLKKGCSICGYNKCASALDFHHSGDKGFSISNAIRNTKGIRAVTEEIKKCIVLCSNCHRELHEREEANIEQNM